MCGEIILPAAPVLSRLVPVEFGERSGEENALLGFREEIWKEDEVFGVSVWFERDGPRLARYMRCGYGEAPPRCCP